MPYKGQKTALLWTRFVQCPSGPCNKTFNYNEAIIMLRGRYQIYTRKYKFRNLISLAPHRGVAQIKCQYESCFMYLTVVRQISLSGYWANKISV